MAILTDLAQILRKIQHVNAFEKAANDPQAAQEKVLLDIIRKNCATEFGRQHNFAQIKTAADYQKSVPLCTYEDLRPSVEKMKRGEANILCAQDIFYYTVTSGTTGAKKLIPVNKDFLKVHKAGYELWFYYNYRDHPKMFNGKILGIVSPKEEGKTEANVVYGSMSGFTYDAEPAFIKKFYVLPYRVFDIKDWLAKYYVIARLGLGQSVSSLITPNPSTILVLLKKINEYKEDIIADIRAGTLSKRFPIEDDIRAIIEKTLKPDPTRAEELIKLLKEHNELLPKHFWPILAFIGCWKEGTMPLYIEQFGRYFSPQTGIRDMGHLASEGRSTVPVSDRGGEGVLCVNGLFFEFIREDEIDQSGQRIYLAHELEAGQDYYLFLTNPAGLYRYNINDVVRVKGFYRRTPILEFRHKGEHVTSVTGEKVTEWQVVNAVRIASKATGLPIHAFTAGIKWGETPRYELLLELHEDADNHQLLDFKDQFDAALSGLNHEYDHKRKSFRLDEPLLSVVASGSYEEYLKDKAAKGTHMAQIKLPCLVREFGFEKNFQIIKNI